MARVEGPWVYLLTVFNMYAGPVSLVCPEPNRVKSPVQPLRHHALPAHVDDLSCDLCALHFGFFLLSKPLLVVCV